MRILLVRLDGVGDAAVCTPLVAALREAGHEVGVALTTRNAGLFAARAIVAEHVLERIPWPAHGSTPASTARARSEIVAAGYDAALIASEEPEAFALARGIAQRVGFSTGWLRPLKTVWVRAHTTRTVSRAQSAERAGAHEAEILYRLGAGFVRSPAPSTDVARLRTVLCDDDGRGRADAIVLQAGPKWAATGVADAVLRRAVERLRPYALRVVAAPGDAENVRATLDVEPEVFPDLRSWMAAIDGALRVVTVDTGAAHVAGMLGTPVVDVFPDAGYAARVGRWRPWAAPYRALRASQLGGTGAALVEAVLDGI